MNLEGQSIGRYHIHHLLGQGGMGEVYLADDPTIHRQVAIKIIRTDMSPYPNSVAARQAAELSQREMKAIASLDHPYILPLFDYGEKDIGGVILAYMVMPYREEGSLAHWLRQRSDSEPLPPFDVAYFIQQAADALQYAHHYRIIHQDVKPSNFLIRNRQNSSQRPDLLLADFGIAKFISATSGTSQNVRGTPTYMAPEQWEGRAVPATDQYALAIMAYELLTGQAPFQGGLGQMMYQHLHVTPSPPGARNSRIPPTVDTVILHALAKKSEERFPSAMAFANALQQALPGADVRGTITHPTAISLPDDGTTFVRDPKNNLPDTHSTSTSTKDQENISTFLSPRQDEIPTALSSAPDQENISTVFSPRNTGDTGGPTFVSPVAHSSAVFPGQPTQADSPTLRSGYPLTSAVTVHYPGSSVPDRRGTPSRRKVLLLLALVSILIVGSLGLFYYMGIVHTPLTGSSSSTQTSGTSSSQSTVTATTGVAQINGTATTQTNATRTAQANATGSAQVPTATTQVTPFSVTNVVVTASPNPVQGNCGDSVTVTYTATFTVTSTGGTLYYVELVNGGQFSPERPLTFNPGETTKTVIYRDTFTLTNGDPNFPESVAFKTTRPTVFTSQTFRPASSCTFPPTPAPTVLPSPTPKPLPSPTP